jgi:hypothetical protein
MKDRERVKDMAIEFLRRKNFRSTGMTHRFVVPSALVELLLAEHTTATLFSLRLGLGDENNSRDTIRKLAHILGLIYEDLQHNMINDIQGKLSDTGAPKFLYYPV